jgi:hypothetical protein
LLVVAVVAVAPSVAAIAVAVEQMLLQPVVAVAWVVAAASLAASMAVGLVQPVLPLLLRS